MNNNIPRKSQTLAKSLRTKASISERRRPFNYLLGCEIYWISLLQKTANFLRKDITLIVRNHLYASLLKSISVNAKILILFYKISMYLCIYKDSFGAKILPDDCNLIMIGFFVKTLYSSSNSLYVMQFFPTIYNFLVIKGNFWVLRCICIPSSCTIS